MVFGDTTCCDWSSNIALARRFVLRCWGPSSCEFNRNYFSLWAVVAVRWNRWLNCKNTFVPCPKLLDFSSTGHFGCANDFDAWALLWMAWIESKILLRENKSSTAFMKNSPAFDRRWQQYSKDLAQSARQPKNWLDFWSYRLVEQKIFQDHVLKLFDKLLRHDRSRRSGLHTFGNRLWCRNFQREGTQCLDILAIVCDIRLSSAGYKGKTLWSNLRLHPIAWSGFLNISSGWGDFRPWLVWQTVWTHNCRMPRHHSTHLFAHDVVVRLHS